MLLLPACPSHAAYVDLFWKRFVFVTTFFVFYFCFIFSLLLFMLCFFAFVGHHQAGLLSRGRARARASSSVFKPPALPPTAPLLTIHIHTASYLLSVACVLLLIRLGLSHTHTHNSRILKCISVNFICHRSCRRHWPSCRSYTRLSHYHSLSFSFAIYIFILTSPHSSAVCYFHFSLM